MGRGWVGASAGLVYYQHMEVLIVLAVAAAIAGSLVWGRRQFRGEIDRARRIRRANRSDRS